MKSLAYIITLAFIIFFFSCKEEKPTNITQEKIPDPSDSIVAILKEELKSGNKQKAKEILESLKKSFPQTEQSEEVQKIVEEMEQEEDSAMLGITEKKNAIDEVVTKQGMKKLYDKETKSTWYVDETTPIRKDLNTFFLYISENENQEKTLRVRIQYASDPWLNAKKYYFRIDTANYTLNVAREDVTPKSINGNLWEYYDVELNGKINDIIKKIASANVVFIKYDGINYNKQRFITEEEKTAIKNMIARFEESFFN